MTAKRGTNDLLPTGTVTFLFTDIEGSTLLWQHEPDRMPHAVAQHEAVLRAAITAHKGVVVKTLGDGVHAAFHDPLDAICATLRFQQTFADPSSTNGLNLRVRCGIHAGSAEARDGDYYGNAVNQAARLMAVAHGGQVVLSGAIADEIAGRLPAETHLKSLGRVRLRDFAQPVSVFQLVAPKLETEFPSLRVAPVPNNLPKPATSFVGRETHIGSVAEQLAAQRLVTLTGPGGIGKTRLALEVASGIRERFDDGVWLIELAALTDAILVTAAVAKALGLREEPQELLIATLQRHLMTKRLLLILDNCEHLVKSCKEIAEAILNSTSHVRILATSRVPLGLSNEAIYPLAPLSVPFEPAEIETLAQFESVRLFCDRAALRRPGFAVDASNAEPLAEICRRLDGIPLALELAAARVRTLSIDDMAARLDKSLGLLAGGGTAVLPRQQTLRALIDWSYDLLTESEQSVLRGLGVFAGGWTLEAAEQVLAIDGVEPADVAAHLASLAQKSLVVVDEAGIRSRLLETLRQYARERLLESGRDAALRQRHREYFLALAENAAPKLAGPLQAEWLQRLDEEQDNYRAALEWSLTNTVSGAGLRLCGALHRLWLARGYLGEGREWCARVLGKPGAEQGTPERAKTLETAGTLAYHQGDYPAARALHEESLAISRALGDRSAIARSLLDFGNVVYTQGDVASAEALYEECLAIRRELGERPGVAAVLQNLGMVNWARGRFTIARSLFEEGLAIRRELGHQQGIAALLHGLGALSIEQAEYPAARALLEESLQIRRGLGDRMGIADSLQNLGELAYRQGDYTAARTCFEEDMAIRRELGQKERIAFALEGLAQVAAAVGSHLRAAGIWSAAEQLREELGSPLAPSQRPRHDEVVAAARAALRDDNAFNSAWQRGRLLTLEQAIRFALDATVE